MEKRFKIRLLTSVTGGVTYAAGDEVAALEETARDLVRAGYAEFIGGQKPSDTAERAVSPQAKKAEKR